MSMAFWLNLKRAEKLGLRRCPKTFTSVSSLPDSSWHKLERNEHRSDEEIRQHTGIDVALEITPATVWQKKTLTHKQSGSVFVMQLLRGSGARTANPLTKVTTAAGIIIFNPSLQAECYIKVMTIVSNCLRGHETCLFQPHAHCK